MKSLITTAGALLLLLLWMPAPPAQAQETFWTYGGPLNTLRVARDYVEMDRGIYGDEYRQLMGPQVEAALERREQARKVANEEISQAMDDINNQVHYRGNVFDAAPEQCGGDCYLIHAMDTLDKVKLLIQYNNKPDGPGIDPGLRERTRQHAARAYDALRSLLPPAPPPDPRSNWSVCISGCQ